MVAEFSINPRCSSGEIREIARKSSSDYTALVTCEAGVKLTDGAYSRMRQVCEYAGASMVYSDRFIIRGGEAMAAPVIDYQEGSLRDDFEFGALLFVDTRLLKKACESLKEEYRYAGLYDLRLALSRLAPIVHIPEFLYYELEQDSRKSGERLFDYVNPRNRDVQIEMEKACTEHLKAIGAFLKPALKSVEFGYDDFEFEASVVIPCKNRAKTIADAIRSALAQKTSFRYNVIVVDDNSDDGTVDIIRGFDDSRLIYIAQDKSWHGIGGNWNAAINDPRCGRFALQLDSDDVYSGDDTLQKVVDFFHESRCAMVIGSYRIIDFNMNELPPGVIDHREWTDANGHNNALRINGLGAPRAFWVPLLRTISFPLTKYGEDYAVALRICREYRIGRIYDVIYNCRRWDGNSDATLPREKENAYNLYKDRIRSWEIEARKRMK